MFAIAQQDIVKSTDAGATWKTVEIPSGQDYFSDASSRFGATRRTDRRAPCRTSSFSPAWSPSFSSARSSGRGGVAIRDRAGAVRTTKAPIRTKAASPPLETSIGRIRMTRRGAHSSCTRGIPRSTATAGPRHRQLDPVPHRRRMAGHLPGSRRPGRRRRASRAAAPESRRCDLRRVRLGGAAAEVNSFDLALVVFWELGERLIPLIRKHSSGHARPVINSIDVHFLRLARACTRAGHSSSISTYGDATQAYALHHSRR